jgi:hypothetical protein
MKNNNPPAAKGASVFHACKAPWNPKAERTGGIDMGVFETHIHSTFSFYNTTTYLQSRHFFLLYTHR